MADDEPSMGDLQDPIHGGTNLVPYFWPYELGGYSLKIRPEKYRPNIYGIGTSNKSDPGMAIEAMINPWI